jgi:hypothetical protein
VFVKNKTELRIRQSETVTNQFLDIKLSSIESDASVRSLEFNNAHA